MDSKAQQVNPSLSGLSFRRHHRLDGGIHTSITRDGVDLLDRFEIDDEEYDPYVAWLVELRCQGHGLPETADEARHWFLDLEAAALDGLERLADAIEAGSKPTMSPPLFWSEFAWSPPGVILELVTGALREEDSLRLPDHLRSVGRDWAGLILGLEPSLHEAL